MKRTLSTLLLAAVFAMGANAQLLYKISGNGLEKPSYIIGTHHLANVGFVDKIPGVKDALTATEQVCGELAWDDVMNPDSLQLLQDKMTLPDGKTLKDVLSDEEYERLDAHLTEAMGVGLSQPQVFAQMGRLKPVAIVTQLQLLHFMRDHMGEFDPSSTFDQYFQAQAKKNGDPCIGLETVAFQADLLYDSTPLDRQKQLLTCFMDNQAFMLKMQNDMTDAYYAQDLDGVQKAMDEKIGNSCDSSPEETAAFIDKRNADWLKKMPAIMAAKPTFFAVGAGHLPGDKGVLRLLRDAGYTVEGVR